MILFSDPKRQHGEGHACLAEMQKKHPVLLCRKVSWADIWKMAWQVGCLYALY